MLVQDCKGTWMKCEFRGRTLLKFEKHVTWDDRIKLKEILCSFCAMSVCENSARAPHDHMHYFSA